MTVVNETGQDLINEYFTRCSQEWEKLYQDKGVHGAIHQERLRLAITMVDRVGTAKRALDIGCGAGLATAEMARRGISVDAVDPAPAMIELTKRRVIANGLEERISAQVGDVNVLPFPDETFDIVVALGVLPWLPDMQRPLSEMVRVLRPGGHLIASMDMRLQLRELFDPVRNYYLSVPRRFLGALLRSWGLREPKSRIRHYPVSRRAVHKVLRANGLDELDGRSIGYGPFSIFGQEILPVTASIRLQHYLQSLANRNTPIIQSLGSQYLVFSQKHLNA